MHQQIKIKWRSRTSNIRNNNLPIWSCKNYFPTNGWVLNNIPNLLMNWSIFNNEYWSWLTLIEPTNKRHNLLIYILFKTSLVNASSCIVSILSAVPLFNSGTTFRNESIYISKSQKCIPLPMTTVKLCIAFGTSHTFFSPTATASGWIPVLLWLIKQQYLIGCIIRSLSACLNSARSSMLALYDSSAAIFNE